MATNRFTFAEQKQNIVKFLQKYCNFISKNKYKYNSLNLIADIAKAKTFNELFDMLYNMKSFVFDKYCMFSSNFDKNHPGLKIWMPIHIDKKLSDEEFDEYLKTHTFNSEYLHHSAWYNITPRRWKNFTKFFNYYHFCNDVEKINNLVEIKKDVAFLSTESNSSDYVANQFNTQLHLFKHAESECDKTNDIGAVIDAYYEAIEDFRAVIDGLQIAKLHGAKYVVDAYFTNKDNFVFDK